MSNNNDKCLHTHFWSVQLIVLYSITGIFCVGCHYRLQFGTPGAQILIVFAPCGVQSQWQCGWWVHRCCWIDVLWPCCCEHKHCPWHIADCAATYKDHPPCTFPQTYQNQNYMECAVQLLTRDCQRGWTFYHHWTVYSQSLPWITLSHYCLTPTNKFSSNGG
jgi:hypothetical protein